MASQHPTSTNASVSEVRQQLMRPRRNTLTSNQHMIVEDVVTIETALQIYQTLLIQVMVTKQRNIRNGIGKYTYIAH